MKGDRHCPSLAACPPKQLMGQVYSRQGAANTRDILSAREGMQQGWGRGGPPSLLRPRLSNSYVNCTSDKARRVHLIYYLIGRACSKAGVVMGLLHCCAPAISISTSSVLAARRGKYNLHINL